jgi:hypothetical protein
MGNWQINNDERNVQLFNSPVEIGLRTLFLLNNFYPKGLSVDKLIYLDYFLIHSGDISKDRKSLHPKYPFRSTEIVVKRELLTRALRLLTSKELVLVRFPEAGIEYLISEIGRKALDYFESDYAQELSQISNWLFAKYSGYTELQLQDIINANIQKWGSEFSNESKFRSVK